MRKLTVLYDARCALCCRARAWLQRQPQYVTLGFVPAGSEEARRRFPQINHEATLAELTVIGDDGAVYREAKAWVMCLWALQEYRDWALRLSSPELMPVARRVIASISSQRFRFGHEG